ncbi:MAG: divergent polysaccharide deacetylase family protein [Proteobacteria bacterium]|nr:divergent polysaccharide deacetylase family protein [Pseudomonadota bacterium]
MKPPRLLGLVWITAGALSVAVLALVAILMFGPGARDTSAPRIATTQLPAAPATSSAQPAVRAPAEPPPRQLAAVPPPAAMPPPARTWLRYAMPVSVAPGQPMIAIVIDDMGLDRPRSVRTTALPAPLTLAYLAYANDLGAQTETARAAGHELLVHVPMEPGPGADPGPNALLTTLTPEELNRRIEWNLSQFTRFVGINNHMGSKATSDLPSMVSVMSQLRDRGLLFLDSRTSGATVAYAEAERQGVPALRRDVFLDHDPSPIAVRAALLQVEQVARRQGHAIAIGHPKDATIDALAEWLPDVRARGFALVPVSAVALRLAAGERRAAN